MKPEKSEARRSLARTKLILDGIKYGLWVPQQVINDVNPPPDENPKVPYEADDGKAPFGSDDDDEQGGIPI